MVSSSCSSCAPGFQYHLAVVCHDAEELYAVVAHDWLVLQVGSELARDFGLFWSILFRMMQNSIGDVFDGEFLADVIVAFVR